MFLSFRDYIWDRRGKYSLEMKTARLYEIQPSVIPVTPQEDRQASRSFHSCSAQNLMFM